MSCAVAIVVTSLIVGFVIFTAVSMSKPVGMKDIDHLE